MQEDLLALSSPEQASAVLRVASTEVGSEPAITPPAIVLPEQPAGSADKPAAPPDLPAVTGMLQAEPISRPEATQPASSPPVMASAERSIARDADSHAEASLRQPRMASRDHSPSPARPTAPHPSGPADAAERAMRSAAASPAKSGQQHSGSSPAAPSPAASPPEAAQPRPGHPRRSASIPLSPFALESGGPATPAEAPAPAASTGMGITTAVLSLSKGQASKGALLASIAAADATISRLQSALAEQRPLVEAQAAKAQLAQARLDELQVCRLDLCVCRCCAGMLVDTWTLHAPLRCQQAAVPALCMWPCDVDNLLVMASTPRAGSLVWTWDGTQWKLPWCCLLSTAQVIRWQQACARACMPDQQHLGWSPRTQSVSALKCRADPCRLLSRQRW